MRPPTGNPYRSLDELKEFCGVKRQIGRNLKLVPTAETIILKAGSTPIVEFKHDTIFIRHLPKYLRLDSESTVNSILFWFGWGFGPIIYGPHRKYYYGLKPVKLGPGSPESDYRSAQCMEIGNKPTKFYAMNWQGKIRNGLLDEKHVQKLVTEYNNRSIAARKVREFAWTLGFVNTAKMGGYKLPENKDLELAKKMNEVAVKFGFKHIAHAYVNGLVIPEVDGDFELLETVAHLAVQANLEHETPRKKKSRKLGLADVDTRHTPLPGESWPDEIAYAF